LPELHAEPTTVVEVDPYGAGPIDIDTQQPSPAGSTKRQLDDLEAGLFGDAVGETPEAVDQLEMATLGQIRSLRRSRHDEKNALPIKKGGRRPTCPQNPTAKIAEFLPAFKLAR
jgi:hypothetical protein